MEPSLHDQSLDTVDESHEDAGLVPRGRRRGKVWDLGVGEYIGGFHGFTHRGWKVFPLPYMGWNNDGN